MGEVCMATPAISGKMLFIRTSKALYAIEDTGQPVKKLAKRPGTVKPVEEAATSSAAKNLQLPHKELTDPVEILKLADAASQVVQSIKYDATVEGTEALKDRIGSGKTNIIAVGYRDYFPEKFIVDGEQQAPDGAGTLKFTGGCDGNKFYVIDHNTKSLHSDFMYGVMGSLGQIVGGGIVREFHLSEPFSDEINSEKPELLGTTNIGGEECYEIKVVYSVERDNKALWCFSKKDFLARRRIDYVTLQDGQKGTIIKTLTNLVAEPKIDADTFKMKLPEGYTDTDQAHQ